MVAAKYAADAVSRELSFETDAEIARTIVGRLLTPARPAATT
jgi:hypothetical protein